VGGGLIPEYELILGTLRYYSTFDKEDLGKWVVFFIDQCSDSLSDKLTVGARYLTIGRRCRMRNNYRFASFFLWSVAKQKV
jgi:hypothetical protein